MPRPIYADSLKEEINSLRVTITGGRMNGKKFFGEIMEEYKKSILRTIDEQPTADVAPKSEGRWEKRVFIIFDSEKVGYRCSECNTTWDVTTNYCPHCGAKMKED